MKLKTLLKRYPDEDGWRIKNGGNSKNSCSSTIKKAIELFKKMNIYETWDIYKLGKNEYSICYPEQKKKEQDYYVIKFIKNGV